MCDDFLLSMFAIAYLVRFSWYYCLLLKFFKEGGLQENSQLRGITPGWRDYSCMGWRSKKCYIMGTMKFSYRCWTGPYINVWLTLSWQRSLSYRNHPYDRDLCHERIKMDGSGWKFPCKVYVILSGKFMWNACFHCSDVILTANSLLKKRSHIHVFEE